MAKDLHATILGALGKLEPEAGSAEAPAPSPPAAGDGDGALGLSSLHLAAMFLQAEVIEALLSSDAPPAALDADGNTHEHMLRTFGNLSI